MACTTRRMKTLNLKHIQMLIGLVAQMIGKLLVEEPSKKQNLISQSTTKAEYVAAVVNCSNIVQLKQLLKGMKEDIIEVVIISIVTLVL